MASYLWSSSILRSVGLVAISDSIASKGVDFIFEVLEIRPLLGHLRAASFGFYGRWCDPILCIHILVWFLCRLCTVVMLDVVIVLDVELTCCKLFCIFFFFCYLFNVGCI